MSKWSKLRAIGVVALVWGGFFGLAGVVIMNGGYYFTDSILGTRDFLLVVYQAFVRFGVLGTILGGVFSASIIAAQALRPAQDLTAGRAAVLGALCGGLGGAFTLAQLFGFSVNGVLFGSLCALGAGLGAGLTGSMQRRTLPATKSDPQLAP